MLNPPQPVSSTRIDRVPAKTGVVFAKLTVALQEALTQGADTASVKTNLSEPPEGVAVAIGVGQGVGVRVTVGTGVGPGGVGVAVLIGVDVGGGVAVLIGVDVG